MSLQSGSVNRASWLKKQLNLLLIAVSFFTRIPIPNWVEFDSEKLNKASRYFGVVGYWLAQ